MYLARLGTTEIHRHSVPIVPRLAGQVALQHQPRQPFPQRELLRLPEEALPPALEALDDDLIARRLSPGGSADLLALALFLRAAAPETWL